MSNRERVSLSVSQAGVISDNVSVLNLLTHWSHHPSPPSPPPHHQFSPPWFGFSLRPCSSDKCNITLRYTAWLEIPLSSGYCFILCFAALSLFGVSCGKLWRAKGSKRYAAKKSPKNLQPAFLAPPPVRNACTRRLPACRLTRSTLVIVSPPKCSRSLGVEEEKLKRQRDIFWLAEKCYFGLWV